MVHCFLYLCISISILYASDEAHSVFDSNPAPVSVLPTSGFDPTISIDRTSSAFEASDTPVSVISDENIGLNLDERAIPEDLERDARVRAGVRGVLHVSISSPNEPISEAPTTGNEGTHFGGFALSLPPSPRAAGEESHAHTQASLSLSQRFRDGAQNMEWERALAEVPEDVKVVPAPCVQGFKRAYTSFADGLSLFSLIFYGISGVASGLGGVDYLSHNAFLPADVMVSIVGLGLIGTALFKYLWVSLSYVKKMDQKRLISYERRATELETECFTDAQLTERFERANIFLMYPSYTAVTARQFLFNFVCCSETVSSTLLAIAGGVFATSSASGITGKDLLHMGSQDFYLGMSQASALAYTIIFLLHGKAQDLKERCEAWLTVQQLAKLYLMQVSGIKKDAIYKDINDLSEHLKRGRENLVVA